MQSIYVSRKNNTVILTLKGRVDATTSGQIHERIMDEIEKGCQKMIIDFASVSYISSSGLRIIIFTSKTLSKKSGSLTLCALNDNVQKIFEISGLSRLFHITEDIPSALDLSANKENAKGA